MRRSSPPCSSSASVEQTTASPSHNASTHKRPREAVASIVSDVPTQPPSHAASVKKSTYLHRRDELESLTHEARALDAQLETLRFRAGLPTHDDFVAVDRVMAHSDTIKDHVRTNDLYLGRLHSMVTRELLEPSVNPMSTFLHLPRDMAQRRAILRSVQDDKLRRGIDYLSQKLHHLDPTQPYLSEEKILMDSGEFRFIRHEINQLPNFQTARQLFDAFVTLLNNMEISVTEGLGQLALREDAEELVEPTIWNHRIVTVAEDVGCTEEINNVGFALFFEHSTQTDSPMGVIVVDTVNIDDLYPYQPNDRTCKDVQAAHMVYELRIPDTKETIIVLKQWYELVQLPPQFELEASALHQLQQNCGRWCGHTVKFLREYVVVDGIKP